MKKGVIITAVVLLSVGLLLLFGGLLLGGGWMSVKATTKTYQLNEAVTDLRIDTRLADIRLLPSTDGTCSVTYAESEKLYVKASVENGILTVKTVDERNWMDRTIANADQPLEIRLPGTAYRMLAIENRTGDVTVPDAFLFESVKINGYTGDIDFAASASGPVTITASTGDVKLSGISASALSVVTSTGRITINGAKIEGDATVSVSTGRAEIQHMTCQNFRSEGTTGRLTLTDVLASDACFIKRSTADVRFDACDAQTITVQTSTGNVTGTLLSDKVFVCKASTGKVRVPNTTSGGRCEITVSTGDIQIEIVGGTNP